MASIGIDFGNDSCVIGIAGRGGIDIALNESSNRRTPSMVSFQGKQRFMGEGALSISKSNFKNTARELKRLVGRTWGEPELMEDLKHLPFKAEKHPITGGVGIWVSYNDKNTLLAIEQIVAMMLKKCLDIAKSFNNGIPPVEVVISIPGWYSDRMRQSMLVACKIIDTKCLRLMHENTATALAYGIYRSAKGEFNDGKSRNVLFLDLGHSSFSASIVSFTQSELVVKSNCYDRTLGGRDMDRAIANYLAEDFLSRYKIDPRESKKAALKLMEAAEKAKKTLSPIGVTDTTINIECLYEDRDYTGKLSLETFEKLIEPLVLRLSLPVETVVSEAKLTIDQLDAIEIVGGATRIPMVKRHLSRLLKLDENAINFGLSCTLNADESVARGCALQCAILSSRFRVKEFSVIDAIPYTIKASPLDAQSEEDVVAMFSHLEPGPKIRRYSLKKKNSFDVKLFYDKLNNLPEGTGDTIASYHISVPDVYKSLPSPPTIRLNIKYDLDGITFLNNVQLMEEVEDSGSNDVTPAKNDEMQTEADNKDQQSLQTEKSEKSSEPAKKKFKKVELSFVQSEIIWDDKKLREVADSEAEMANIDRIVQETSHKRNELESFIYSMRDRIASSGDLSKYGTPKELNNLKDSLNTNEDWLYSDEGFDSTLSAFSSRLQDMQVISLKLEERKYESTNRDAAINEFKQVANVYKNFANSKDEATAHISIEDKNKVRECIFKAEEWLHSMLKKQSSLPLVQNPVIKVADIGAKVNEINNLCKPIMSQPKPKPPKPVEEAKKSNCT
mmetsp:Transcript_11422/g.17001  ORF Transcript_11422/g.17001 Transcript_11422/m.17001 type:complete len:786 (+) Transcript_11422:85-2442(+)